MATATQAPHRQQMTDLCKQIHTIGGCDGVDPWNERIFARVQRGRSEGERIAASFVLAVWCGGKHGEWSGLPEFDAIEAAARCDKEIVAVMTQWMLDPFWP